MARPMRLILPANQTLRFMYAALIIFGMNAIIGILRMVATAPRPVKRHRSITEKVKHGYAYDTGIHASCRDVNAGDRFNGSFEISAQQQLCKTEAIRVARDNDVSDVLSTCGFDEEYQSALIGTPLEPLESFLNPCWLAVRDRHQLDPTARSRTLQTLTNPTSVQLRCMPYVILVGSSQDDLHLLRGYLDVHPHVVKAPDTTSAWVSHYGCGSFVKYVDSYSRISNTFLRKNTERDNWLSTNRTLLFKKIHQDIIYEVSPHVVGQHGVWTRTSRGRGPMFHMYNTPGPLHRKTVAIVSNPVTRCISQFRDERSSLGQSDLSKAFDDEVQRAIAAWRQCTERHSEQACAYSKASKHVPHQGHELLVGSMYHIHFGNWLRVLPRTYLHVINTNDLRWNSHRTLQELWTYLRITAPGSYHGSRGGRLGVRDSDAQNWVHNRTLRLLGEFFQPFNEKLAAMLDDDRFVWNGS